MCLEQRAFFPEEKGSALRPPVVGNVSDDSLGTRVIPTRAQSAVVEGDLRRTQSAVADGDLRPTPENYLQQNPTVPKYLKTDGRQTELVCILFQVLCLGLSLAVMI